MFHTAHCLNLAGYIVLELVGAGFPCIILQKMAWQRGPPCRGQSWLHEAALWSAAQDPSIQIAISLVNFIADHLIVLELYERV